MIFEGYEKKTTIFHSILSVIQLKYKEFNYVKIFLHYVIIIVSSKIIFLSHSVEPVFIKDEGSQKSHIC